MDTYHWDVLVTYHWDVIGCFIWDLFETLWRRTDGTSSLRPHETSSRYTNKTSWRRTTETSWRCSTETLLGVSFETCLRRYWDVQIDVVTTSSWRLVAGWVDFRILRVQFVEVKGGVARVVTPRKNYDNFIIISILKIISLFKPWIEGKLFG